MSAPFPLGLIGPFKLIIYVVWEGLGGFGVGLFRAPGLDKSPKAETMFLTCSLALKTINIYTNYEDVVSVR